MMPAAEPNSAHRIVVSFPVPAGQPSLGVVASSCISSAHPVATRLRLPPNKLPREAAISEYSPQPHQVVRSRSP